jgi:uncharacterized protein
MHKFFISCFFLLGAATALSASPTARVPANTASSPSLSAICRNLFELIWRLNHYDFVYSATRANARVWAKEFQKLGRTYVPPKVKIFEKSVVLPTGEKVRSYDGPFYWRSNQTIYLTPEFGTQPQAAKEYVIAHEAAHHVQNLLGYAKKYDEARAKLRNSWERNENEVRRELHAEYLAGKWARLVHGPSKRFGNEDIADIFNFIHTNGDDALAKLEGTEFFEANSTHGTSVQRKQAFAAGFYGDTSFEQSVVPAGMPTFEEMITNASRSQ